MTQIDRILARHQITNGTGPVIAYQVENEFYNNTRPPGRRTCSTSSRRPRRTGSPSR